MMQEGSTVPAEVRLVAFPYAGGSSTCYKTLAQALPGYVRVVTHELPGHGTRIREPLVRCFQTLVDDAVERLSGHFTPPYAFYGHSMGAWLARDVIQRLVELGKPLPVHLFVSGRRAPQSPSTTPPLHEVSAPVFRARLAQWGGTPRAILEDAEMMAFFERTVRADVEALEGRKQVRAPRLHMPIHVMLGVDDDVSEEQAAAWQLETWHPLSMSHFPGGHFFIHDQTPKLANLMQAGLFDTLQRASPPRSSRS
jgi:medium-chain acyl-[acyl-carrier-protein] hydrolase